MQFSKSSDALQDDQRQADNHDLKFEEHHLQVEHVPNSLAEDDLDNREPQPT